MQQACAVHGCNSSRQARFATGLGHRFVLLYWAE